VSRLAALALTVAAVLWARAIGGSAPFASAGTALVLGFALVGAWLTGDLLTRLRLPKLTGYLVFGAVIGPYLGNVINAAMAAQLQFVTGIATTLIALIAGLTLNVERLGARLSPITRTTLAALAVPVMGLLAMGWFAWPWLPIAPEATGLTRLAMLLPIVLIVVSFSPTMTAAVMAEAKTRGRLGDLVLAMAVIADLVVLVLFAACLQGARALLGSTAAEGLWPFLARIAWEIGGAMAFGAFIGSIFALYLRYIGREMSLALLGFCALLSQAGSAQRFEPLLAAVTAGFVIENLAVSQGDAVRRAVRDGAPPVLVVFFVAIGASLRLDAVATMGLIALALSAVRVGLVWLGVKVGIRVSGLDDPSARYAWTGLISQAGITLGFASVLAAEFPGWGERAQLLIVGSIAVHELVGPMVFRHALIKSETGALLERPMVVVSNREPYVHSASSDGGISVSGTSGGVAVALDALMRERGGVWIAHGSGSGDRAVVDAADKVMVPPDRPTYSLRRLWLEEPTFSAYYGGLANEGLWPLCHAVDVRPTFRAEDWAAYQAVNRSFAHAIDHELGDSDAPVFLQDYHLSLVASDLRRLRPAAKIALFWHIPWPYPDRLRICPWRREILAGLLANDLIAFQLERDRRNFLMAVEEELGAEVEEEASRVSYEGRYSTVVAVPIGVDFDRFQSLAQHPDLPAEQERLRQQLGLRAPIIGVGVDRLDYTKGIPERLAALDALMTSRPDLRGQLTFVQIGIPSRSSLESYAAVESDIGSRIATLNARHGVPGAPPLVVLSTSLLDAFSLTALYRLADFCVVSSLHDGMNLVAKEFVAARDDEQGVLVLSELAGAAQELEDALIINPYDQEGFMKALSRAIEMPAAERTRRMRAMRKVVAGRNVFSWASDILEGLESIWSKPLIYSVRGWEERSV
jgi:trehalose-6-phosphate synthase/Kef-type K+ transport system membrane component KefB